MARNFHLNFEEAFPKRQGVPAKRGKSVKRLPPQRRFGAQPSEARLLARRWGPEGPSVRVKRADNPPQRAPNKKRSFRTVFFVWSGLRGSNSLPPPWQGGALPDELNPHTGRAWGAGPWGDVPHLLRRGFGENLRAGKRGRPPALCHAALVAPTGIEPVTRGFSVPCSTN